MHMLWQHHPAIDMEWRPGAHVANGVTQRIDQMMRNGAERLRTRLGCAGETSQREQQPDDLLLAHFAGAADAVPGPDGALYVSDDTAGAIYRLMPPG